MSPSTIAVLLILAKTLSWVMQASILVPMVVVWRRGQYFSPAVRLLSWYVYLSLLSSVGARLSELCQVPNWPMLAAFNFGKIALFGGVYYLALHHRMVRQLVLATTGAGLAIALYSIVMMDMSFVVTFARVLQCALLAGFALAYLEQVSREPPRGPLRHNPLFLVSVGQLFYSAGTVMYFSLNYLKLPSGYTEIYFGIVAILGLVFNTMLTLAFLRAQPEPASQQPAPMTSW
jgi:hypothetical protein